MEIKASLTFDSVRHDQDTDVHLVLSLQAPKTDWQTSRPAVCIIPIIDNSGSMAGEKLDKAKKSVMKLFDQLQAGDYAGLASFSTDVDPIAPPREMTQGQKDDLKAKAGALRDLSSTNFAGGMLCGLGWASRADLPASVITRVIMFTDGNANCGVCREREPMIKLALANLGRASVSAFGYGKDADQELLGDLSKACGGNYAFIENPDDAMSAFAKELGGLLSTYAQNVELCFEPQNGHKISEVLSDVNAEEKDGKVYVKIPDILSEEVRNVVLSLRLKEQPQALPRDMTVVNVSVSWDVVSSDGKKDRVQHSLKSKVRFVKPGEEQKEQNKALGEIVGRDLMVKAQVEAEGLANAGNFSGAAAVMDSYSLDMERGGYTNLAKTGANIRKKMGSHSMYAASVGYRNVMKHGMTRAVGVSGMDDEAFCDISEAGVQVSTSSQQEMINNMVGGNGTLNVPPAVQIGPFVHVSPPVIHMPAAPAPAPSPKQKPAKKGVSKSRSSRW